MGKRKKTALSNASDRRKSLKRRQQVEISNATIPQDEQPGCSTWPTNSEIEGITQRPAASDCDETRDDETFIEYSELRLRGDDYTEYYSRVFGSGFESDEPEELDVDDVTLPVQPALLPIGRRPGIIDIQTSDVGPMDIVCIHCGALHFQNEVKSGCSVGAKTATFSQCCGKGKIILPELPQIPRMINDLFSYNHVLSPHFMETVRKYNSSLAFASMCASKVNFSTPGPYCYKIHGQVYHCSSALENEQSEQASYAQLYVLDSDLATEIRMERNDRALNYTLLKDMADLLGRTNLLAKSYQMMKSVIEKQWVENPSTISDIMMVFDEQKSHGSRKHNVPVANEIAAVFVSDNGEVPTNRGIVVMQKDNKLRKISVLSPFLDPMTYPLFFPHGERGWGMTLKKQNGKRMTLREFYAYRLSYRERSHLHRGGKLLQQYIVDAYCKIEENRLNYIRTHQKELRAESYRGLADYVSGEVAEHDADEAPPGKKIILPSSFHGGPRSMGQLYQDAMTIVGKVGKPDLFITFTCNPAWPEIKNNLNGREQPQDRPDLVSRVFKLKMDELLYDDLLSGKAFGDVSGHVGVVEFQKRGLPHAHILLTLKDKYKLWTAGDINQVVSAVIPGPDDPELRDCIHHMIHNPCGESNPNAPCMVNGKCCRSYPQPFSKKTKANRNGFPVYKRPEDGYRITINGESVGNEWVVPYNSYLLRKYKAHINVEVCATIKSVKYLHKYIYKGHDAASLVLKVDEIENYLDARYVGSPESMWRINMYPLHFQSHSIIRLAVHLEEEQSVVFEEGHEDEAVDRATDRFTTLTGYFAINESYRDRQLDPEDSTDPRNYRYIDMPDGFVFKPQQGWEVRKRQCNQIGRMYFVAPSDSERFHLRLLLLHVKGAVSFESLRTVNDVTYPSYKTACEALGLVSTDDEWEKTLTEACDLYDPSFLREIFAEIIVLCCPSDPVALWDKFKDQMSEDFTHRGMPEAVAVASAYHAISDEIDGRVSLETLIPKPPAEPAPHEEEDPAVIQAAATRGAEMLETLNPEQRAAADAILSMLDKADSQCRSFFIDGPGGSGKTYLYQTLNNILHGRRKSVINIAWSGIAAQLLPDGRTVHNLFRLPVPVNEDHYMPGLKPRSQQARMIKDAEVIIWDEAPTCPRYAVEGVDLFLRDLMQNNSPFGGKILLFGGDFRQIPPIVLERSMTAVVEASLKRSYIWPQLKKFALSVNMRAHGESMEFIEFLMRVGNGLEPVDREGCIKIPENIQSSGDLIKEIYGDDINLLSSDELSRRAILTLRNFECGKINAKVLKLLPGAEKIYLSVDEAITEEGDPARYPPEFLHGVTPSGLPPHELKLKVGALVMLLRNLNVRKGLCNGTRLIVQKLNEHSIECQTVATGRKVVIPRIDLHPCDSNLPFTLKRRQFPVKLCFAMTVNKSQGQSFDRVGVYLPSHPFSHGHLYVALSRTRSLKHLKVLSPENLARNVVLPELLR